MLISCGVVAAAAVAAAAAAAVVAAVAAVDAAAAAANIRLPTICCRAKIHGESRREGQTNGRCVLEATPR